LLARVDVRFNHYTRDGPFSGAELLANSIDYFGLVIVILLRITMAAIDHDTGMLIRAGLEKSLSDLLNGLLVIVRPFGAASKYDVEVGVASCLDDGS